MPDFRSQGPQDRRGRGRDRSENPARGDRRTNSRHSDRRSPRRDNPDLKPRTPEPELDDDITGEELDRVTLHQIRSLEANNAQSVSKHLVMVGRYLFEHPETALEHARYAVSRAGRVAAVREAAAVAAYESGEFHEALKEFRTYRRMSGDDTHLPLMVDCERALGKSDKALELAASPAAQALDAPASVELAIVVAGILRDRGDTQASLKALEIPQLDRKRGFSYSPRLFRAYADALHEVGRDSEAQSWRRHAIVAESALGAGQFSEPEIVDLVGEEQPENTDDAAEKYPEGGQDTGRDGT
ncbi:MAG: hypothetical protein Q4C81_07100 [Kocuria sp.]|nr:hypothetical protein [Kocuria sp.]